MSDEIVELGVIGLADSFRSGHVSPTEVVETYLGRIEVLDASINSFISVTGDAAMAAAEASADRWSTNSPLSPLDGVPIALKDNIDVAGVETTAGIEARRKWVADEDAAIVARFKQSGAVLLGKLNMHEGAFGATTNNEAFGACNNPHAPGFTPGGSSGGSGAALAAGFCAGAIGSDTLGSVRIPSSLCGVAGIKPTYGLASTRGVLPLSWTLDHVGPMARSIADLFPMMGVICGFDAHSPFSARPPSEMDFSLPQSVSLRGVRLGVVPLDLFVVQEDVLTAFQNALDVLEDLGAQLVEIELGDFDVMQLRRDGLLICEAEVAHDLHRDLNDNPDGFTSGFHSLVDFGANQTPAQLIRAYRSVFDEVVRARALFASVDALVSPTTPQAAFPFSAPPPGTQADFTFFANFARIPAVSVPMGFASGRLPVGLQIMAPEFEDAQALSIALAFERAAGHNMAVQE